MKKALFYGSLRKTSKRGFNFNKFGGQTYLETLTIAGYDMFDLDYYPAICEGRGSIVYELHDVTDESFENIRRMELGAGYSEVSVLVHPEVAAALFVYPKAKLISRRCVKIINNGDWS